MLEQFVVDPDELLPFARVFAKTIVGDPIKPGGKPRFPAKTADILVGPQESFLGKIVGQSDVGPGKLPEQTSHARLMILNQFGKSMVVIIE